MLNSLAALRICFYHFCKNHLSPLVMSASHHWEYAWVTLNGCFEVLVLDPGHVHYSNSSIRVCFKCPAILPISHMIFILCRRSCPPTKHKWSVWEMNKRTQGKLCRPQETQQAEQRERDSSSKLTWSVLKSHLGWGNDLHEPFLCRLKGCKNRNWGPRPLPEKWSCSRLVWRPPNSKFNSCKNS